MATATKWKMTSETNVMKAVTATPEEPFTRENCLALAGLDWDVKKAEVNYFTDMGAHTLPQKAVTYRTDTGQGFDTVGTDSYAVINNRFIKDLMFDVLEQSAEDLQMKACGYHGVGQRVFFELGMPSDLVVEGDRIATSLAGCTRHDGGGGFSLVLMFHRFSCTNQFSGLQRAQHFAQHYRHRGKRDETGELQVAGIKLADLRADLKLVPKAVASFEEEMKRLLDMQMPLSGAQDLVKALVKPTEKDPTERSKTIALNKYSEIMQTYQRDPRVGFVGTAWGLTQAVSTWEQHLQGKSKTSAQRQARAHLMALEGPSSTMGRLSDLIGV